MMVLIVKICLTGMIVSMPVFVVSWILDRGSFERGNPAVNELVMAMSGFVFFVSTFGLGACVAVNLLNYMWG